MNDYSRFRGRSRRARANTRSESLRSQRRRLLAELIQEGRFHSQEELNSSLVRSGVEVAQATLSRDLKSLGVGKRPGPDGRAMYVLPQPAAEVLDRSRLHLDLKAFINSIDSAQNLVVVRTPPGHAHAVGRAIDLLEDPDVVGSVAGDDTVLVVLSDSPCARRFRRQLLSLSGLAGARRQ